MQETTLKDIMTTRVATIGMDANVEDIRSIFNRANFHHLVVADEGEIVGVISGSGSAPRNWPVSEYGRGTKPRQGNSKKESPSNHDSQAAVCLSNHDG